MAVIKLAPGSTTRVPTGALTLHWQPTGMAAGDASLTVVRTDDPAKPAPAAQRQGIGTWLLPAVPVPASVLAASPAGVFPDGGRIDVQLLLDLGGAAGDTYVLPSTDVSGTAQKTLVKLTPTDGAVEIAVPAAAASPPAPPATAPTVAPLLATSAERGAATPAVGIPPLAQRSVYRARELAGPEGQLRDTDRRELHVAVDRSASMLPFVRDGARQALLEVLAGLNEVAGSTSEAPVWQLGTVPQQVRPGLSAAAVADYDEVLGATALTTGTVLAPLVAETARSQRPRTVVILTDGVPADLDDLEVALQEAADAGSPTRWHVLALARSVSDPGVRAEPWRDELTGLAPLLGPGLTLSSVTPDTGAGWLARRLEDPKELSSVLVATGLIAGRH